MAKVTAGAAAPVCRDEDGLPPPARSGARLGARSEHGLGGSRREERERRAPWGAPTTWMVCCAVLALPLGCEPNDLDPGYDSTTTTTNPPECIPSNISGPIDDDCGVFVSSSKGKDTNAGTKEAPFATLARALDAASGKAVYACSETFSEALALKDDATFYGGLDCAKDWAHVGPAKKTTWTADADATPVHVLAGARITMADFVIAATDASAAGGSSIALLAEAGTQVHLDHCDVSAGNGAAGADGELPSGTGTAGEVGSAGTDACTQDAFAAPGSGGQLTCDAANVAGGDGGNGTKNTSGGDGSDGKPSGVTGLGGKGQDVGVTCDMGGDGAAGAPGVAGEAGLGAPESPGTWGPGGYTGVAGSDGKPGQPGQGGGGGGGGKGCANAKAGPSGGGGGSGGCAGAGGKGGGGGGGSFGIVSLGSKLTLTSVTITVQNGGKGGDGGAGQPGGTGGTGGMPGKAESAGNQATACTGGKGGDGGAGGKGGGGRGGPSIGIAYTGDPPDVKAATITKGTPGDGGAGDGPMGAGAKGVAADTQAF